MEHTCPDCGGRKIVASFVDGRDPNTGKTFGYLRSGACNLCQGTGLIDTATHARIQSGKVLRDDRVSRKLSQKQEAARLGIGVLELNARERGRTDEQIAECKRRDEANTAYFARDTARLAEVVASTNAANRDASLKGEPPK